MPYYIFKYKNKTIEVFQHMNEPHVYIDEFGIQWERVFTKPNAAIDTQADPYSVNDFAKKTNKKGTIGDLMDQSQELSIKRKDKDGVDPIREKYYDSWSKRRKGRTHPDKQKTISDVDTKKILKKYLKD